MKVRYTAIGAAAVLPLVAAVTVPGFESMPPEHLRQEGILAAPAVGKTTTPAEPHMVVAGVAALVGIWIYPTAESLKRRAGGRGRSD